MSDRCSVCNAVDAATSQVSVAIEGLLIPVCGSCRGSGAEPWVTVVWVTSIGLTPQQVDNWRRYVSDDWAKVVDATLERTEREEIEFRAALWVELTLTTQE